MADSVSTQDDDSVLKSLIDLAENCPKYLRPQLETVVNLCMKVRMFALLMLHDLACRLSNVDLS